MRFPRLFCLALSGVLLGRAAAGAPTATPAPVAHYMGVFTLVRYDQPLGFTDGLAPSRQAAVRRGGDDAVEWPDFTLNGQPLFRQSAEEALPLPLRQGAEAASPFQLRSDDVVQPGNHWLRAMRGRGRQTYLYTADRNARTGNGKETMAGRYELWTFPVRIGAEGSPAVKNVQLRMGQTILYKGDGPWRSLTLLLPATEPGRPYELSVDGRPVVRFELGLQPVKAGTPREMLPVLDTMLAGEGAKVRVQTLTRSDTFPHAKEWAADLAALAKAPAGETVQFDRPAGFSRYLGVEVPRSPLFIYAAQLPGHGSAGFFHQGHRRFTGSAEEYAAHVAKLGFDAVFDQAPTLPAPGEADNFEARAVALAHYGVKLGLQYDTPEETRPSLQNANLPLFAHTLPEWHAPLYRSLSLAAQRFNRLPNFAGLDVGANSTGYAADWTPSPPAPNRPWGRAMIEFLGTPQPTVPRPPRSGPAQFPFEYAAKDTAKFVQYVQRYDAAFQEYEYFAEAVRQVSGTLPFTTSCFGSAPGPGARGGWPWASLPGRSIFGGLNVLQAHDWNDAATPRPVQALALADRLSSYWARKTTWLLLDASGRNESRTAYQQSCALALTRGVQGLGTDVLLPPEAKPAIAAQQEMHAWAHRFGGVYANGEPAPTIGIFYGHHLAVQRTVLTGETPSVEAPYAGSHEGKVTEAFFLCHAAGWPARVITYQELMREPLPASMKAILIVGAGVADASWNWGPGLEKPLQAFLDRGGRVLVDDESTAPVPSTATGLHVAAFQPAGATEMTPMLLERNATNIEKLRAAMEGTERPLASSSDPRIWAIPSRCGDVLYLTATGIAGATAGTLAWQTERPVYDLRQGRALTPEEAGAVDFTKDSFQLYAVPPRAPSAPVLTVSRGTSGFYEVKVECGTPTPTLGIPLRVVLTHGAEAAEVFGATGFPVRLPLTDREEPGEYVVKATELLSGTAGETSVTIKAPDVAGPSIQSTVRVREQRAIKKFATRKNVPLTIGLTKAQADDAGVQAQVKLLQAYYEAQKRTVAVAQVGPGSLVESLQPLRSPHRYPQWKTIPSDLLLLGTPADNVLLLDQRRAEIFPLSFKTPAAGTAELVYTRSPFIGEFDVVNIIAPDLTGLAAAVKTLTSLP